MKEIIDIPSGIMTIYDTHFVPDEVLFADDVFKEKPDTVALMKEALQNHTKLRYMCMNSKEVGYWFEFTLNAYMYARKKEHAELMAVCDRVITMIFDVFGTDGFVRYGGNI